jgi:hypothetical protein
MVSQELIRQTAVLAAARRAAAASNATLRAAREQFDKDNATLIEQARADQTIADLEEQVVRKMASIYYDATQIKQLSPGLEIAVGTDYTIDEAAGLAWAKEKDLCLIPAKLDLAAVKKLATVQPLPFVTTAPKITVRIATDLDKALAKVDATTAALV